MVFYRKYRPQTLAEMIGQDLIKQTLKTALANNKLAHAYLFCGPRGTGKTSTARILAKMVNCENVKDGEPCGECAHCLGISNGSDMDLIEIDAASNRGIDDIRALRETIKLAPTSALKKVYIIDEVHMLSNEAFNALLKTLEEPPSHALFILATTEVQKIPATILSRVQKLDFQLASSENLVQALEDVAKKEGIQISVEALQAIAKRAGGSFRDGIKLLDQLASSNFTGESSGEITVETVEQKLGSTSINSLLEILTALSDKDAGKALTGIHQQFEKAVSPKELNTQLLELISQLILIKSGLAEKMVKGNFEAEEYQKMIALAEKFQLAELLLVAENFQESTQQLKFSSLPTLPLEVAVVKCANPGLTVASVSHQPQIQPGVPAATIQNPAAPISLPPQSPPISDPGPNADLDKLNERWSYLLETIRQQNYSLEALLRSAKIYQCANNNVILEVRYLFHQRIIEAPKSREMLESVLSDILEHPVHVSTVVTPRAQSMDDVANLEVAEDDETIRMVAEIFSSET